MKTIAYEWRLREVMAASGMFSTTKLAPLLRERGIDLSTSQIYRLVAEKPERLNLNVLVALMDILGCTADDLVRGVELGKAVDISTGTTDASPTPAVRVLREQGLRPRRAEINPPDA